MVSFSIEVSLARTALKLGLEALCPTAGQKILVPDYCCSVLRHPIEELDQLFHIIFDDLTLIGITLTA